MTTARTIHTHSTLERAAHIALVLAHHELWYLIEVLNLESFLPAHIHRGTSSHQKSPEHRTQPEQLRLALEELGPTFMKLGQMLSIHADLLPPEYQHEFAKLQDAAPTIPIETVREMITAELTQPLEQSFATFDAAPLAAASIGQAHLATLQDGTEVVVKVRRPGSPPTRSPRRSTTAWHRLQVIAGSLLSSMISLGLSRSLIRACERNWTICMKDTMLSVSQGTLQTRAQSRYHGYSGRQLPHACSHKNGFTASR